MSNVDVTCSNYPQSCTYYNFEEPPTEPTFNKVVFVQNFWLLIAMFICFHIPLVNIFICSGILVLLIYTNYKLYKDYKTFKEIWDNDTLQAQIALYYSQFKNNIVSDSPQNTGPARLSQY